MECLKVFFNAYNVDSNLTHHRKFIFDYFGLKFVVVRLLAVSGAT